MRHRLVLYTRTDCHLCADMLAAARPIAARHGLEVTPVDIDTELALARRYNLAVPVLELDGRELCRHFLDPEALERALAARP